MHCLHFQTHSLNPPNIHTVVVVAPSLCKWTDDAKHTEIIKLLVLLKVEAHARKL